VLAGCLGLRRVPPGWEEVTNVVIVQLSLFLHGNVMSLDVVVAVDGPSMYLFGQLLHDGLNGGVINEGLQ